MLKFEQLMDGSYFENTELSESQVASLFDEHATFKEIIRNVIGLEMPMLLKHLVLLPKLIEGYDK